MRQPSPAIDIRNAAIDGTIEDGTISLRHASAVVDRVIVSAAGTLAKDGVVSNGAFTLEASDAARLQAALPQAWQATRALWQGPVKLAVQAAGPLDALSLGIRLNSVRREPGRQACRQSPQRAVDVAS